MPTRPADPATALLASGAPDHAVRHPSWLPRSAGGGADTTRPLTLSPAPPGSDLFRVTVALAAFLAVSFVLLNIGIYESARKSLVRERWDQLTASTEEKRKDLRALLQQLGLEAQFISNQREFREWIESGPATSLSAERALALERELDQAAASFRLKAIEFVGPDGVVYANSTNAALWRTARGMTLAQEVLRTGREVMAPEQGEANGKPSIIVAVPVGAGDPAAPVAAAVVYAGIEERFGGALSDWTAPGPHSGGYLAALQDGQVAVLTAPPPGSGLYFGDRLPLTAPRAAMAVMAARGLESAGEIADAPGGVLWAVSRPLPEIRCGLVGQADRATMLAGMRRVLAGLLLLDIGAALLVLFAAWQWRRQHRLRAAQREAALAQTQGERIQSMLDNAFDAIIGFDARGRVTTANAAAERLFQRSVAEMEGRPLERFLHWWDTAGPGASEPLALGKVSRSEAVHPDGTKVTVEFSMACSGTGEDLLYTVVARDISETVEAERKICAFAEGLEVSNRQLEEVNAQLEQASRLKSEFLANTSHELRTPLNGIMGFLQLVLDGLCGSKEEERDFLGQALQCSRHLLGLINDVLDIAKIEAGKLALQIEAIDIGTLFDDVYTVTHVQAQQKGLTLLFERPPDDAPPARGDFGKTKQVLINLIGNSLKFTPHGSIIVRAAEQHEVGHYLIEVVDTGIGIPPDRQGVIFEKFTQGDGSATRRFGGTGLGLAITRNLVELMGGVIGVDSKGESCGTRMYFSLPVWRGAEAGDGESDATKARMSDLIAGPAGGTLVLVVEDDSVFRRLMTVVLQQHGYRTAEATTAETGWMLARRLRPSIVLLDHALSCAEGAVLRSGWDLAQRMGSDPRTRSIPLVFVTGFEALLREKLRTSLLAHQPQTLTKPVDPRALIAKIEQVLGDMPNRIIRVLLADDDPAVSAYLGKVLPAERFHLEVVNDGEECLHLLRTQPRAFDLLLLDLMMPGVSGYDVLREMTLKGTAAGLPVIALTNFPEARNEDERRLLEQSLVLEVVAKSAVHENPRLLPQIIDSRLEAIDRVLAVANEPRLEVERFQREFPEGDEPAPMPDDLRVERFKRESRRRRSAGGEPGTEQSAAPDDGADRSARKEAA